MCPILRARVKNNRTARGASHFDIDPSTAEEHNAPVGPARRIPGQDTIHQKSESQVVPVRVCPDAVML
jgi:hypothetical protein